MLDRFMKLGLLCVGVVLVLAAIGLYAHFYPATVRPVAKSPRSGMFSAPTRQAYADMT